MSALQITQEFFDQQAPVWDYHLQPDKQSRLQAILNQHSYALLDPLLDLGCGSGILLSVLPEQLQFTALDLSFQMLSRLKERYTNRQTKLLQADAHRLPLKSGQFNTVICFQSLPHFTNRDQLISEVRQVLNHKGIWIILHLMDHFQLNDLHLNAGEAVAGDVLPAANILAEQLISNQFSVLECREEKDLYLLIASKR